MDALRIVEDEVALEGLDGTTIPTLWIRLESRKPAFPLKLDDATKALIWRFLVANADLRFYQLPREREDVELYDRFKETTPTTKKDVYPVQIILENKDGIQGSCAVFKERTNVTNHVRSKSLAALLTLEEALERYGRKLVVAASQTVRFRALIGPESDPDLKLNDDSYCMLERVGRGRWQGELQSDLHGSSFKVDARKLHYMRKSLVKHGLVSMQSHTKRLRSGQMQHSILLRLKRFHVSTRSKYDLMMEYVSDMLLQFPDHCATLITIRQQLNVNEKTFKRVFQHMRAAKYVEICRFPLQDLDNLDEPCLNKRGNKVLVRCMKLLKPYTPKGVDDDDDDDEEEDDNSSRRRAFPPQGRIMERDVLSQTYQLILSCGTKGIPQSHIGYRMNVGKLESRMLCRKLQRDCMIKGFLEDEGRQRTTKFISHKCVEVSDKIQLFAKEQERQKLLLSSAPPTPSSAAAASPETPTTSKRTVKGGGKGPAAKRRRKAGKEEEEKAVAMSRGDLVDDEKKDGDGGKKAETQESTERQKDTQAESSTAEAEHETPSCPEGGASPDPEAVPEEAIVVAEDSASGPGSASPRDEEDGADANAAENIVVVESVCQKKPSSSKRPRKSTATSKSHETFRLLRRKNLIVEAVRNLKIVVGLFPLQKMINEEEKESGLSCKCCKKTILRLVHGLSREGLLKMFTTTVVQDGISKKVDLIVHPSIQPKDDAINKVIDAVRFRISSSYTAARQQQAEEKTGEQPSSGETLGSCFKAPRSKAEKKKQRAKDEEEFKPTTVRGLGRSFGFQPKMHRLRIIHNFLWYVIYGHPLHAAECHPDAKRPETPEKQDAAAGVSDADRDKEIPTDAQTQPAENGVGGGSESAEPKTSDSTSGNLEGTLSSDDEDKQTSGQVHFDNKDEDLWKKFIPPVSKPKEWDYGWAMVADILLCLPLSIFVQVVQVNYKVDDLEQYLTDPVKQHSLLRELPARMRRQLFYKRKYIFTFHENLQKLAFMGLLQFGPIEKFKEKDQVFVYLRRKATIVDTINAEPHYWLVSESNDRPFERRQYTFNAAEDVKNYWFDLMCVCLNTPLGVVRNKRNVPEEEMPPPFVRERHVFAGMADVLKGSNVVCDDGSIPGDKKGAGGLHSEFFAHLKRNWLLTNHLLAVKPRATGMEAADTKIRLKSLLSKSALRIALKAGGSTAPRYLTAKRSLFTEETVELAVEPASRNQQVVGGKRQKRKRPKKEVVKVPRKKKKEPQKRGPAHDEADHRALKMMTRQRVFWSVQEDSLMMLCSVASYLINCKLKRAFVPYCVVRDILHAEFEISMDKTSLAVGRRSRYILRNTQTFLNYRICLAEVHQDKALLQQLEENKPADPNNPEDCAKAFTEYVKLLRQKFSSVASVCDTNISDSKRQLFARYKVCTIDNGGNIPLKDTINRTEDIHSIVLHNLIQSTLAMTNSQMKSSRSFLTFHIYSKFDQEVLCQVFIQCRKRGLVNRRRVSNSFGPKKNRSLPILPMSYQLSQSYYRLFSWRFPHSLCTDSFRFLRTMLDNGMEDKWPAATFHHETESRMESSGQAAERSAQSKARREKHSEVSGRALGSTTEEKEGSGREEGEAETANEAAKEEEEEEEAPDPTDMLCFSLDSTGGACVVSLSLMTLGLLSVHLSIPKQMVVVDSNLVDNDVVKSMAALEEEEEDDYDGEECEGKKRLEVKAHQASHTNYLMMRGYCCPGIVKLRNLNTNDNIVVESCTIRLQLRNTPAHSLFTDDSLLDLTKCGPSLLPSTLTHSIRFSSASSEECERRLVERGYTPQDVEACARLRRSLDAAGDKGLDAGDLQRAHAELLYPAAGSGRGLLDYLEDLQEEAEVLRAGAQGRRWVLLQHAEPWLLTVDSKKRQPSSPLPEGQEAEPEGPPAKRPAADGVAPTSDAGGGGGGGAGRGRGRQRKGEGGEKEDIDQTCEEKEREEEESVQEDRGAEEHTHLNEESFISRPWRMVDGKLNRQVCKGMLEALLYHVMSRPGITQQTLVEHYKDALQPMVVLDLMQALIEMGCVVKKTLVKRPKVSLFGRPARGSQSEAGPRGRGRGEGEPDAVFFEPTISCCLRLSQVLPNERHWNYCSP